MKFVLAVIGLWVICTNLLAQQNCALHIDDANDPEIRHVLDEVYSLFANSELLNQPLTREDILLSTKPVSVVCVQHGVIILSASQIRSNITKLKILEKQDSGDSIAEQDQMIKSIQAILSHEYAHLSHKKYSLFMSGKETPIDAEYHADFIAGYLSGRAMVKNKLMQATAFCISADQSPEHLLKAVFEMNKGGMRTNLHCLIQTMNEYIVMNSAVHPLDPHHEFLAERRNAYANGFACALNYEVQSWSSKENEKVAAWVEFFYGPLSDSKKRFSRNLFSLIGEDLNIVMNSQLVEQPLSPSDMLDKSYLYCSSLIGAK